MEKVKALIPVVKAEDEEGELVDPQAALRVCHNLTKKYL